VELLSVASFQPPPFEVAAIRGPGLEPVVSGDVVSGLPRLRSEIWGSPAPMIFDDLDQAMDTIETSLYRLHEMPEMLRSMTAFPWILEPAAFDVGAFVD
jgi:hypothetical protein